MWIEIIESDTCRYHISNARFLAKSFLKFRAHKLRKNLRKHAIFESMNDYDDVENSTSKKNCEHCFLWNNEKRVLFDQILIDSRSARINRIETKTIFVVIIIRNASSQIYIEHYWLSQISMIGTSD